MPDSLGRYYLSEMEDRVFRLLKQKQAAISTAGVESNVVVQGQAFSTVDIDQQINSSLVGLYTEIVTNREDQFSQTSYQSVQNGNAGPYGFPPGMLQLRYMDWIDPGIGQANALPEQWVPMMFMDDPMARQMTDNYRGPTWQYDSSGSAFILNSQPTQDNPNGVRIRAVVLPAQLSGSNAVIQARFALVLQEAVIFDAAYVLAYSRLKSVTEEISVGRQEWHQRLITTAENAHKPPSTVMVSNRIPALSYSGRRRGRGWGYGSW